MSKIVAVCFFFIFISVTVMMGLFTMDFGAPSFFTIIPFVMAGFGFLMCIAVMKGGMGQSRIPPQLPTFQTGDMRTTSRPSRPSRSQRGVYDLPSHCPDCGAAIHMENVSWVGPMQAQCPYCSATINAGIREI